MAHASHSRATARALLVRGPMLLPAAVAAAVLLYLGWHDGGYQRLPATWMLCAIFLLALLVFALVAVPAAGGPPRLVWAAAALLGAYAAWSYASIAWAEQKADALDGANRTALYAVVFALFALWPLGRRGAVLLIGALGAAIGVTAVVALLKAGATDDPRTIFLSGRLAWPVEYPNATVALWFIGFWPCAALAARREVHPLGRGVFLALAFVLAATSLLAQSRGWLFAVPIVTLVFLVVSPARVRVAWTLTAVALGLALVGARVIDVQRAVGDRGDLGPVDVAVERILLVAFLLGVLCAGLALIDRSRPVSRRAGRLTGQAMLAAALAAVAIGAVAFVAREGDPIDWVDARWEEFKGGPQPTSDEARFTQTLGSNRYDFWRVAWDSFGDRPLAGIGADNFRHPYLRARVSYEEPYYPHSILVRTLAQTGLIGFALLAAAVACAAAAALRAIRRLPGLPGAAAAGALTSFAYFLVHGGVDWFWELSALGGLAWALAGIAAGLHPRPAAHPSLRSQREPLATRPAALGATTVVCGLLLAALVPAYLSTLTAKRAAETFNADRTDASKALERLDRAAGLNPWSTVPRLLQAQIVVSLGQQRLAVPYYRDAIDRDSQDEYAHLALGAIESAAGNRREARLLLARAVELSPRDELARDLLRDVVRGKKIGIGDVNKTFNQRLQSRAK